MHVSFETRAARASEALKNLGQIAKIDFQTTPQTEGEILIISVKDMPMSDLMAKIATATSGEWKLEGKTYRLIASQLVRRQEERAEAAARLEEVNRAIAQRVAGEQKQQDEMDKAAKKAAASAKTQAKAGGKADAKAAGKGDVKTDVKTGGDDELDPAQAAEMQAQMRGNMDETAMFTALIRGIDPAAFAQMESGQRIVFSTEPTRMQRGLGGNATAIINDFIQKHNATVKEMPVETSDEDFAGMSKDQIEEMRTMMRRQNGKIGQISKALLVASKTDFMFGMGGGSQLELRLYDAKGQIAFSSQNGFQDESDLYSRMASEAVKGVDSEGNPVAKPAIPAKTTTKPPAAKTPVEYSEDSKALMKASTSMSGSNIRMTISDDLRRKLYLPNVYDPLSFATTDEILSVAKAEHKPVVADVPDTWYSGGMMSGRPDSAMTTVEQIKKQIEKKENVQTVPDADCIVLKPAHPERARNDRLDRLALTALLQATDEKGVPSLADYSAFALRTAQPRMGDLTQSYLFMFIPNPLTEAFNMGSNWSMLRFWGLLNSEQRSVLLSSGKIPISGMTTAQRAQIEQLTYGANAKLALDDPNKKTDEFADVFSFGMDMAMGGGGTDYRSEATEVAPAGLPADGYIEAKATKEFFASPVSTPGTMNVGITGILSPVELALFGMMKSAPNRNGSDNIPSFGKLRIGERVAMKFTIHLAPQVVIRQSLNDHRMPKDAQVVAENSLPADFQKQVDERMAALKASPFGSMMAGSAGMFGGEKIHP